MEKRKGQIYHYTSLNTFFEHILPKQRLKLSRMENSRDPYEYQPVPYVTTGNEDQYFSPQEIIDANNKLEEIKNFKRYSQYLCFSVSESRKETGLFYQGFDRPRMWEQYGEAHHGVCLGFEKSWLDGVFSNIQDNENFFMKRIEYEDFVLNFNIYLTLFPTDKGKSYTPEEIVRKNLNQWFFRKGRDYQDENELRFLHLSNKTSQEVYFSITTSMRELIFGEKVSKETITFYYPIIKKYFPNVTIYQMSWTYGSGTKNPFKIDTTEP